MTIQKKILIAVSILSAGIGGFIIYNIIRINQLNKNTTNIDDVQSIIDKISYENSIDTEQPIPQASSEDEEVESILRYTGNETGNDDLLAAVMIDGILFTGNRETGIYYSTDSTYNWNMDEIVKNGQSVYVNPLDVIYGYIVNSSFLEAQ